MLPKPFEKLAKVLDGEKNPSPSIYNMQSYNLDFTVYTYGFARKNNTWLLISLTNNIVKKSAYYIIYLDPLSQ